MLNWKEIIKISKELSFQFNQLESMLIWDIARRIKSEINGEGNYTQSAEKQMQDLIDMGYDSKKAREMIANTLKTSSTIVDTLVYDYAMNAYQDDHNHYLLTGKKLLDFEKNGFVVNLINTTKDDLKNSVLNLSNTTGFVDSKGKFNNVDDYFRKKMNEAVFQIASGAFDYNSVTRRIVKEMASSGVRTVNYESGVSRNLESTVKNNILTGLTQMAGKIALQNAIEMGEDLMEITAHAGARPTHAVWQGKIVSLTGRIGYLSLTDIGYGDVTGFQGANCYHDWFVFFEDISEPKYTQEQLEEFNDQSKKYEYNGKWYSEYEAGQKMRQIERSIAQVKRELVGYDAVDDKDMFTARSIFLRRQRELYDEFADISGQPKLPMNQLVYDFDRKKASQATWAYKNLEREAEKLYNIGDKWDNIRGYLRDKNTRDYLKNLSITIDSGQYNKHVKGTNEYKNYHDSYLKKGQYGPSYLTLDEKQVLDLVNKYKGQGILTRGSNGKLKDETITISDKDLGYAVNNITGKETITPVFKIKYKDNKIHVIPDYPSKKGAKQTK